MQASNKLTPGVQVGYAAAEAGINTVETILRFYLLAYYTEVVGLAAHLAGIAAALAIVWDAVTDPIMGVISDRTRHRFGGRRGYLPVGGLLLGLGLVAVFWPPALDGQAMKFGWLLLAYCFLNTGMTVLSVPYMAMAAEITEVPHERTRLFGARFAFSNAGAFLAAGLPVMFTAPPGAPGSATMPQVALVAAAFVTTTALISWSATARVRLLATPIEPQPLRHAFTAPFANPSFVALIVAYVVAYVGIGVNATTFYYYYEHVLELPVDERQTVLAVFVAAFTLSIAVWVGLARRYGKRRPLVLGATVLGAGTMLLYLLVPPRSFELVLWIGAIGLGSFAGSVVLLDTLLTDVLDHDLLRTRQLRSGLFFGVWRFASKMARAVSMVLVGTVLGAAGFVEQSTSQPPSVHFALVLLFGPGVGGFFLVAAWLLWRQPLDDDKQAQVRRLLARRAARERRDTAG